MFQDFGGSFGGGPTPFGGSDDLSSSNTYNKRTSTFKPSIQPGGSGGELVRPLGDGLMPTTLLQLQNWKPGTNGELNIKGVSKCGVRLVGWVINASKEETEGEFLFKFTDGTVDEAVNVLLSVPKYDGQQTSSLVSVCDAIIDKCTLRGSCIYKRMVITGSAGINKNAVVIRAMHIQEADTLQGAFYHPIEVLASNISISAQPESAGVETQTASSVTASDAAPGTASATNLTLEELKKTKISPEVVDFIDQEDEIDQLLGFAIERLVDKSMPPSSRLVKVRDVLNLLVSMDGIDQNRTIYLDKLNEKVANFEMWIPNATDVETKAREDDKIYYLANDTA